jgi:NADPH-dependent 2,4-dienoyl-CoA reductase/sulfur reductase-like enzyme/nitrite reductase/ring-hydroxylating ferredoxin subunit
MADSPKTAGPDFTKGIAIGAISDGAMLRGRVGDTEAVLARVGDELFAVGAHCTHYHGALADGLLVGDSVRCPLHHACFSLRTGEALRAPALDPIACWRVERQGDTAFVREKLPDQPRATTPPAGGRHMPASVVIVGGGGAGLAAADMLRREGYEGPVTMISADDSSPVDRPNLSKDYLAGTAQDDWMPLRGPEFFAEQRIDLLLNSRVSSIDLVARQVLLDNGSRRGFDALLIATGADPVRLPIPGGDQPQVRYLRSFADGRTLVKQAAAAKHVAVVGASFIGLEVAASLRQRGIAVDVIAPEKIPLERIMGADVGRAVQALHEAHGVVFHLGKTVTRIDGRTVTLSGGTTLDADIVAVGVGVRPATTLAEKAGLAMDRGIAVSEYLETSASGVFAAGDVARWPDARTGDRIRVEHWVVAERQGQVAARNMLGRRERFTAVPFFWSQHYDITINYVGHAEQWDSVRIDGTLAAHDCTVSYLSGDRRLAVATMGRDRESLEAELAMERDAFR